MWDYSAPYPLYKQVIFWYFDILVFFLHPHLYLVSAKPESEKIWFQKFMDAEIFVSRHLHLDTATELMLSSKGNMVYCEKLNSKESQYRKTIFEYEEAP